MSIYKIKYYSTYSEAWDGYIKTAYIKAPVSLRTRRGELEKLCRKKFQMDTFKIDSIEEIKIVNLI